MLTYLRITDFAILDDVELTLGPGMTVLTGETGTGKSLIIDAVHLLRGGRASADLIRAGAEEARVEAVFAPPPGSFAEQGLRERLGRAGIESNRLQEDGLVVRRVIGKAGRSRVYLGGQLVTAAALSDVCGGIIDIAGQHEHQTLMEVGRHLRILDNSGVPAPLLSRMAAAYERLRAASEKLQGASLDERARAEREEFLRFQLDELRAISPRSGEDASLRAERERLRSVERLDRAARRAEDVLYSGDGAVLEAVGGLLRELQEVAQIDGRLGEISTQLGEAKVVLEDVAHGLRRYADTLSGDPDRLLEVEDRLHQLSRLLRKHGPDLDAVLKKQADMEAELQGLCSHEERRAQAQAEVEAARAVAAGVAAELSLSRMEVAGRLAQAASAALSDLSMTGAALVPRVDARAAREGDDPALIFAWSAPGQAASPLRRLSRDGWDRCELLLSPNPGEEARPLQRIASGGELSRVMLALKRILGEADGVPTYVFDEIDTGIGGATADRVGRQIRAVSERKQVVCITHLAQIAAHADDHYLVEKKVDGGRTRTVLRRLKPEERREEVARMLGGARITSRTRAHAAELLREAK